MKRCSPWACTLFCSFVMSGQAPESSSSNRANPAPAWLDDHSWKAVLALSNISSVAGFADKFVANISVFKQLYESESAHRFEYPAALPFTPTQVCFSGIPDWLVTIATNCCVSRRECACCAVYGQTSSLLRHRCAHVACVVQNLTACVITLAAVCVGVAGPRRG